jgi:hypothetical protein
MKLKSIALALSFAGVLPVVANEDVTVQVGTTTVEVEVSSHEVDVTTTTNNNETIVVSISTPEQEKISTEAATTDETATVSTEEVAN